MTLNEIYNRAIDRPFLHPFLKVKDEAFKQVEHVTGITREKFPDTYEDIILDYASSHNMVFDSNGNIITKEMATAFWKDLMGTIWHDPERKTTSGKMSVEQIAYYMGISPDKAEAYLWACVENKLTDRQGGAFVV